MKRFARFLLWSGVFVLLLVAADQVLIRVPLEAPGLREFQSFYREFRGRLLRLPERRTAEPVLEEAPPSPATSPKKPASPEAPSWEAEESARFVYVDDKGELHFAAKLEDVPPRYREEAQRMK